MWAKRLKSSSGKNGWTILRTKNPLPKPNRPAYPDYHKK